MNKNKLVTRNQHSTNHLLISNDFEVFILLGCYAALCGSYWHSETVYQSIFKGQAILEDGTDRLSQKLLSYYHWMLRNIREEWRPHLHMVEVWNHTP